MRLSLHEVLAIVGRLDDAPGYDTPRERFRRFLIEHMTSVPVARTFLDEAQQLISEQYQRALQDTVLATGRLLGFETTFGAYERHGGAARDAGQWLSRRRLAVTVQLWSDDASLDDAAVARAFYQPLRAPEAETPCSRLAVVSPSCSSRHRIEAAIGIGRHPTRIVSVRSLMDLLAVANRPPVTHDDVVRLLSPDAALEGSIGLLTRLMRQARRARTAGEAAVGPPRDLSWWVYVVREHDAGAAGPAGVSDALPMLLPAGDVPAIGPSDRLAFLVPSRGVVAQAEIGEVAEDSAGEADQAEVRFIIRLKSIVILDPPTPVETEQRLNLELQAAVSHEPCVRVSREEFEALTLAGPFPDASVNDEAASRRDPSTSQAV